MGYSCLHDSAVTGWGWGQEYILRGGNGVTCLRVILYVKHAHEEYQFVVTSTTCDAHAAIMIFVVRCTRRTNIIIVIGTIRLTRNYTSERT